MSNVPSLPWWGWAIAAFFVLNVVLQMDVSIVVPLLMGIVLATMLGRRRQVQGGQGPGRPLPHPRPGPPTGPAGEQAPAPGHPGPDPSMPRIDVPRYPDGTAPAAASPPAPASPSTDPVVSLGQLHLSRCSRDLHAAATTGSSTDVARVLDELKDQSERLVTQLAGAGSMPGSGRREFESGLRRLLRDVEAARGEQPPGARVARAVRAAGAMGQTGRYE